MKLDRGDYVEDVTHMQTLVFLPLRGAVLHMHEIVIVRVYFFTPRYIFNFIHHRNDRRNVLKKQAKANTS